MFDGPSNSSPAKMQAYYGDSSHRDRINIGWILAGLGLFFLLWFVACLRETARGADVQDRDRGSLLGTVIIIGGTAYAAVAMAAIGLAEGIRTMSDDTYHHEVYSGIIHAANDGTYVMHATGTAGLAAMILAFSLASLNTGALPRWLVWFGFLAVIAALASITFVTMFVWLLWILVTSVVLFTSSRTRRIDPPLPRA
jgi:hypothetical protein